MAGNTGWLLVQLTLQVAVGAIHLLVYLIQNQSGDGMIEGSSGPIAMAGITVRVELTDLTPSRVAGMAIQILVISTQRPTSLSMSKAWRFFR